MAKKEYIEAVVREFPALEKFEGKTRSGVWKVRVVENVEGKRALDIREYLSSEEFAGFTRKGIRLDAKQLGALISVLPEVERLLGMEVSHG